MNKTSFLLFLALAVSAEALFTTSPLTVQPCQSGVAYDFNVNTPSFLSTDIPFPHFLPHFLNGSGSLIFDVPCNASGVYQFSLNAWNAYYNQTSVTQVFVYSNNNSNLNVLNPTFSCACSNSKTLILGGSAVSIESPFQYWLSPDNKTLIQNIPCSTTPGLYSFKVFSNSKQFNYALNVVKCNFTFLKAPSVAQACVGVFSTTLTLFNNQNSNSIFNLNSNIGSVLSPIELPPFTSKSFTYSVFFDSPGVYPIQINVSNPNGLNSQSNFIVNVSSCTPRFLNLSASGFLSEGQAVITIHNNEGFDITNAVFQVNKTISKPVAIPSSKSVTLYFPFNSSLLLISGYSPQGVFNQTINLSNSPPILTGFAAALPYAGLGVLVLIFLVAVFLYFNSKKEKTDEELFEEARKYVEN